MNTHREQYKTYQRDRVARASPLAPALSILMHLQFVQSTGGQSRINFALARSSN
jgi:hypothetical protein